MRLGSRRVAELKDISLASLQTSLRGRWRGNAHPGESGEPCVGLDLSDGGTGVALTAFPGDLVQGQVTQRAEPGVVNQVNRWPHPPCASIDISGWRVSTLCSNVVKTAMAWRGCRSGARPLRGRSS